jgi:hypothetical protein
VLAVQGYPSHHINGFSDQLVPAAGQAALHLRRCPMRGATTHRGVHNELAPGTAIAPLHLRRRALRCIMTL